jgi:dopamine beta-monooxygenase
LNDSDVKKLTLRIPETEVQQHGSKYMCTHLHAPMEGNYHVVAVEPLINNTEVVHHIILFGCHKTGRLSSF